MIDSTLLMADEQAFGPKRDTVAVVVLNIVRDVFPNPFRVAVLGPTHRTPAVSSLAQAAYDERDLPSGHINPARLAVLSDALEESGCADGDLLSHLRASGPHIRGCWALDLILGKQ